MTLPLYEQGDEALGLKRLMPDERPLSKRQPAAEEPLSSTMSTECTTCQPDPQQPEAQIAATAETTVVDAVAPDPLPLPRVTIEFCDRVRFITRWRDAANDANSVAGSLL